MSETSNEKGKREYIRRLLKPKAKMSQVEAVAVLTELRVAVSLLASIRSEAGSYFAEDLRERLHDAAETLEDTRRAVNSFME